MDSSWFELPPLLQLDCLREREMNFENPFCLLASYFSERLALHRDGSVINTILLFFDASFSMAYCSSVPDLDRDASWLGLDSSDWLLLASSR